MATSISAISGNCTGLYDLKGRVRLCTIQLCREEEDSINQSPLGGVEAVGPLASSCEICIYAGASVVVRDPGAQPGEHEWCIAISNEQKESVRLEVRPFDSHDPDVRFVVRGLNIDEFEPPARGGAVTLRSKDSTGRDNSMDTHSECLELHRNIERHWNIERHFPFEMKDGKQRQSNYNHELSSAPLKMWQERLPQRRILVGPPKKPRKQKVTNKQGTGALPAPVEQIYVYTKLSEVTGKLQACYLCVYGVIAAFTHPSKTKGPDHFVNLSIVDESLPDPCKALSCNLFHRDIAGLPTPVGVGVVIRLHRVKVQLHDNKPQLVGNVSNRTSWVLMTHVSLLRAIRQQQQQSPLSVSSDSMDESDERSSSRNRTKYVFPASEWKMTSASKTVTTTPEDGDRVRCLVHWRRESWAPEWRLCVNASGGGPNSTTVRGLIDGQDHRTTTNIGTTDCIGCILLVDRDSDGIVERLHLWDGTHSTIPSCESSEMVNAKASGIVERALVNMEGEHGRVAVSIPLINVVPGAVACIKIEQHGNDLELSQQLCEGMWVRLRKIDVQRVLEFPHKEVTKVTLSANGCINPLPPDMREVNELLLAYQKSLSTLTSITSSNNIADVAAAASSMSSNTTRPIVSRRILASTGHPLRSIAEGLAMYPPCTFYSNVRIQGTMPVNPCLFVQKKGGDGLEEFLFTLVLHDDTADVQAIVLDMQRGVLAPQVEPSQFTGIPAAEYMRTIRNFKENSVLFEVKISTLYLPAEDMNGELLIHAVLEDSRFSP